MNQEEYRKIFEKKYRLRFRESRGSWSSYFQIVGESGDGTIILTKYHMNIDLFFEDSGIDFVEDLRYAELASHPRLWKYLRLLARKRLFFI